MLIAALFGALAVGLMLGLMGSGGSILTVPVLTYVVGQHEKVAIAGSLGIVGGISLIACLPYALRRLVDWRSVVWFGLPGVVGAWLGAALSKKVDGAVQLGAFAVLMLVAGVLMLRPHSMPSESSVVRRSVLKAGAEGLLVGIVTGFVGVGGGFLIVPALVLLGGLPMNRAIGTSLVIIAAKSLVGFVKYLDVLAAQNLQVDWQVIALFTSAGIAGSFAGAALSKRMPQPLLRRVFAVFLFVVAAYIVMQNWQRFA